MWNQYWISGFRFRFLFVSFPFWLLFVIIVFLFLLFSWPRVCVFVCGYVCVCVLSFIIFIVFLTVEMKLLCYHSWMFVRFALWMACFITHHALYLDSMKLTSCCWNAGFPISMGVRYSFFFDRWRSVSNIRWSSSLSIKVDAYDHNKNYYNSYTNSTCNDSSCCWWSPWLVLKETIKYKALY